MQIVDVTIIFCIYKLLVVQAVRKDRTCVKENRVCKVDLLKGKILNKSKQSV